MPDLLRQQAELLDLWHDVALPELASRGPLYTGRPKACLETVRRMELWVGSMQLFRDPAHHQAAAAGARALFELLLDIKSLASDPDGSLLRKFQAFPEVEHFRVSQKIVDFYARNPSSTLPDLAQRQAYVADTVRRDRIHDTCRQLWVKDPTKDPVRQWPKHWTDRGSEQRAREHGREVAELHVLAYPQLSFYLHSGAAGVAGSDAQEEALMGFSHTLAVQCFLSALALLAQELSLAPVLGAIDAWARRWHDSSA